MDTYQEENKQSMSSCEHKKCSQVGCKRLAFFGHPEYKPIYCEVHRTPEAIKLKY